MNKVFSKKPLKMLIVYNTNNTGEWIGIVKNYIALWSNDEAQVAAQVGWVYRHLLTFELRRIVRKQLSKEYEYFSHIILFTVCHNKRRLGPRDG